MITENSTSYMKGALTLCLFILFLGHAGAQRPDLFWVGGFE